MKKIEIESVTIKYRENTDYTDGANGTIKGTKKDFNEAVMSAGCRVSDEANQLGHGGYFMSDMCACETVDLVLVSLEGSVNTREAVEMMKLCGLEPAKIPHLLSFLSKETFCEKRIVALGSKLDRMRLSETEAMYRMLCYANASSEEEGLKILGKGRGENIGVMVFVDGEIDIEDVDTKWNSDHWFLAFKNQRDMRWWSIF